MQYGVPIASLITVIGSCAVAVGLALQGGLSNIAGGLMILIFKPFQVGDYIKANDLEGTVKSITMFYTTITIFFVYRFFFVDLNWKLFDSVDNLLLNNMSYFWNTKYYNI